MVGLDELLRQPQDEVTQDRDGKQARPHPTSISYFLSFVNRGQSGVVLTVDALPVPSDLP